MSKGTNKHNYCIGIILSIAVYLILTGGYLRAQTDAGYFQFFQMDSTLFGARSIAMGGTAIANGYDLASTRRNPANLIILRKSMIEADLTTNTFKRTVYNDNFNFSSTYPAYFGIAFNYGSLAFSFYQHKMYRFNENFSVQGIDLPRGGRTPDLAVTRDMDITTRGFNIGLLLTEDLAAGIGFNLSTLKFKSNSIRNSIVQNPVFNKVNAVLDESDNDSSWSFGILLSPKGRLSIGVTYQLRNHYALKENRYFLKDTNQVSSEVIDFKFWVPPEFGVGASYRISKGFNIAFDFYNKYYSKILSGGFKVAELNATGNDFKIKDIKEYHAGIEYMLPVKKTNVMFFRGGFDYIPGHAITFIGSTGDQLYDEILKAMYPEGKDAFEWSFGTGANISMRTVIDAAFHFSSIRRDVVITGGFFSK